MKTKKLQILVAEHAGFCFGVKRAIQTAFDTARLGGKVYTLGPLIHNPQVIERLKQEGVEPVERPNQVRTGKLIIRAHGVSPARRARLAAEGLEIIDATCPIVKRSQDYVARLAREGYQVLVIGDPKHPEVDALLGFAPGSKAVNSPAQAARLSFCDRLGVVVQTTLSLHRFREIIQALRGRAGELKIFNTRCNSTDRMQKSTLKLARKVDIMLVIGGHNSANTKHLAEICRQAGVPTYHIEQADELRSGWFRGLRRVGITAGASTPQWLIEEVLYQMTKVGENHNEERTGNRGRQRSRRFGRRGGKLGSV